MASITDVRREGLDGAWEFRLALAGAFLFIVSTFASGFFTCPQTMGTHSLQFRMLAKLQQLDYQMILLPVALHPWTAIGITALAVYSLPLYGLATKRYRDKDKQFNALVWVPFSVASLGMGTLGTMHLFGWAGEKNIHYYSWLIAGGLTAIATVASYTWFFAFKPVPSSLEDRHRNPHLYDVEDLRGAAMTKDLKRGARPLLLRFSGCDWPNLENANVQRKLAGRLVIGRFYNQKERTNYWVCPEIENLQQTLVVAPPGAGKTHSIALPWTRDLPQAGHSAFAIDVKGDMAETLRPFFRRRRIPLYSFNPEDPNSLHWNPFDEVDRSNATELYNGVDCFSRATFGEIKEQEKFWELSELGYLRAAVELLIRTNPNPIPSDLVDLLRSKECLIATLSQLTVQADAQAGQLTREDRRAIEEIERGLQLLVSDAEQKRTGYYERIQGAFLKIQLFNDHRIARITQSSSFRLKQITERPSAMVFAAPLSLGLDSSTLAAIATRFLQQLIYTRFKDRQKRKLFFILDEFSKLQLSAKEMEHFVSTSRSAGCVTVVILQGINQLNERARAELLDNLADRYVLHGAESSTVQWFERTLHERTATRATVSQQQTLSSRLSTSGSGTSITETTVPVLAAREIHNTGGLQYGAWLRLAKYSSKPILVDLERPRLT